VRWRGGGESGSMGHSCRGLMPRVEELEPRNVPQHPLKREAKREGAHGKTRAPASDVSCTARSFAMFMNTGSARLGNCMATVKSEESDVYQTSRGRRWDVDTCFPLMIASLCSPHPERWPKATRTVLNDEHELDVTGYVFELQRLCGAFGSLSLFDFSLLEEFAGWRCGRLFSPPKRCPPPPLIHSGPLFVSRRTPVTPSKLPVLTVV